MNKEHQSVLQIKNISKSFADQSVLKGISFDLQPGETIGILGKSGAGKSTLFHIVAGLTLPDDGEIILHGQSVTGRPGKIHYMLQKDLLLPFYKIIDNVSLPLRIAGVSKQKAHKMVQPLFESFGLSGTENFYPSQLSGGMRQRASLLRTYVNSNGVFLFDEPFSALDAITRRSLQQWYCSIAREMKFSTLLITHDIDEALFLCDRILILENGTLTARIPLPEHTSDFLFSPQYLQYKKEILERLQTSR